MDDAMVKFRNWITLLLKRGPVVPDLPQSFQTLRVSTPITKGPCSDISRRVSRRQPAQRVAHKAHPLSTTGHRHGRRTTLQRAVGCSARATHGRPPGRDSRKISASNPFPCTTGTLSGYFSAAQDLPRVRLPNKQRDPRPATPPLSHAATHNRRKIRSVEVNLAT